MYGNDVYGLALIALGACGLLIYVVLYWRGQSLSGPRSRPSDRPAMRFDRPVTRFDRPAMRFDGRATPDLTDVGQQLHAVMGASFRRRRLLNRSEYETFRVIEAEITAARCGYRVFAQTSLGEVLTSPDDNAFYSINAKRVDILIVDQGGWPVVAVEYQGAGHYQGTAAARDAIKKEALRKAGVGYVEILEDDTAEQIRSRVREQLGWHPRPVLAGAAE